MKTIFKFFLITFVLKQSWASAQNAEDNYSGKKFTPHELKEDFHLLRKALEEAHPALYKFTSKKSMDSLFNAVERSLNKEMTEANFWTLLAPVFGKIQCGHTRIYPSDNYRNYFMTKTKLFPFDVRIIDNKLIVSQNLSNDSTIRIGTEIVSINKTPVSKILPEFLVRTWADGKSQTMHYIIVEQSFYIWYNLILGESEKFSIEAIHPKTHKKIAFTVSSITINERRTRMKKNSNNQPLQYKVAGESSSVGILTIKTFEPERIQRSGVNYNSFIDSVFVDIKNKNIQKLIIDLRNNNGGGLLLMSYLYSHIAEREFNLMNFAEFKVNKPLDYFDKDTTGGFYKFITDDKGRFLWKDEENDWYGTYQPLKNNYKGTVYVLTDGGSFSSSGFFASYIQYYKRGKIIGEEAGGASICNDCHANLILPNTKIKTEIARCTFSMNLPGIKYDGHGVIPDFSVKSAIKDIIHDSDPVLKFAMEK